MLLIFVPRPNGSINIPIGIYEDVENLCALFFTPPLIGQLVHRYKIEPMTSPSIYLLTKGKLIIKTGLCVKKIYIYIYYILEHKEKKIEECFKKIVVVKIWIPSSQDNYQKSTKAWQQFSHHQTNSSEEENTWYTSFTTRHYHKSACPHLLEANYAKYKKFQHSRAKTYMALNENNTDRFNWKVPWNY